MNNLIMNRAQLVEIPILASPGFGAVAYFADVPEISKGNIKLYGIEVFNADLMSVAPSGLSVVAASDVPSLSITLVTKTNEKRQENMPYYGLIRSNNGGFITLLDNIQIDLTKCYMGINAAGGLAVNQVGLAMLYYSFI